MATRTREEYKMIAKLAEQAERFGEMVENMKAVVEFGEPLNEEERNLLSVAFKNVVGSRRTAWRVLTGSLTPEITGRKRELHVKMKEIIEKEIIEHCKDILKLLQEKLIPNPEKEEAEIFFLKMKGDYYRYMVEIRDSGEEHKELVDRSDEAYKKAQEIAINTLKPTNPIRLGLALNYSVFFYEVKKDSKNACDMAKTAFDDAIGELDQVDEQVYKDSTLIMQLLRDNLTLWNSEMEENQDEM